MNRHQNGMFTYEKKTLPEQPTLRDLYAMAALTGLIARDRGYTIEDVYEVADECMKFRAAEQGGEK